MIRQISKTQSDAAAAVNRPAIIKSTTAKQQKEDDKN